MPKFRLTKCYDDGYTKGMWFCAPIDMRKKYYKCHHCQKEHLVKDGVVKSVTDKVINDPSH
jgi:hypothetical protein